MNRRRKNILLVTPLSIAADPIDDTEPIGAYATFGVSVYGANDKTRYQWQRNSGGGWSNVTSGTGYLLRVPVSSVLNLSRFRCVVTDEFGKKHTSGAATLYTF